ncbi:MAG: co-chaperone GroES [Rhodospirillales bacterium]|jgi:chaperonin GroES|nr:co-chaperone GroES [Rhodospirillales bacterium]
MNFRPLHDRVLVKRVEQDVKTAGGIIIPDSAQEKPMEGKIVSVGSGIRAEDGTVTPLDVKAGDLVLFGKWSGTEIKVDGEDLLIMKESDILGILDITKKPAPAKKAAPAKKPAAKKPAAKKKK